ncbi:MAG: hypothetical protein JNK14_07210, partial [Chitinophagaceae bacterium]|nr:hypothetical protein [Chitinophagaceae bacterium]
IKTLVQNLLQRTILQDLSLTGKFIIILLWIACFAAPVLVGMPLRFF